MSELHKWEHLGGIPGFSWAYILRMRVPGGWLYQTLVDSKSALAFVPDRSVNREDE